MATIAKVGKNAKTMTLKGIHKAITWAAGKKVVAANNGIAKETAANSKGMAVTKNNGITKKAMA